MEKLLQEFSWNFVEESLEATTYTVYVEDVKFELVVKTDRYVLFIDSTHIFTELEGMVLFNFFYKLFGEQ